MAGKAALHEKQPESQPVPSEDFRLQELDARLQHLSGRLPSAEAPSEAAGLRSRRHTSDSISDLRAKMDGVRWMLRVAKHTEEPARERILVTISDSLDQLERVFAQRLNAA
jgi:hypothetical protein